MFFGAKIDTVHKAILAGIKYKGSAKVRCARTRTPAPHTTYSPTLPSQTPQITLPLYRVIRQITDEMADATRKLMPDWDGKEYCYGNVPYTGRFFKTLSRNALHAGRFDVLLMLNTASGAPYCHYINRSAMNRMRFMVLLRTPMACAMPVEMLQHVLSYLDTRLAAKMLVAIANGKI